jgi:hypothetical protein
MEARILGPLGQRRERVLTKRGQAVPAHDLQSRAPGLRE